LVIDYETGADVERRGPFTDQADVDEAVGSLREERKAGRYVIRVRVE